MEWTDAERKADLVLHRVAVESFRFILLASTAGRTRLVATSKSLVITAASVPRHERGMKYQVLGSLKIGSY